jgi:hypothetical protein
MGAAQGKTMRGAACSPGNVPVLHHTLALRSAATMQIGVGIQPHYSSGSIV